MPGRPGVVGDDVDAARLQRREDRRVHARAVDAHGAEVVVVEHQRHEVEAAGADRRRRPGLSNGWTTATMRARGRRLRARRRASAPAARGVCAVDAAARPDGARQQLGRVAAAGADVEHHHAGPHADEGEHLDRLAAHVVAAIGVAAVGAGDDRLDLRARQRSGVGRRARGVAQPLPRAAAARPRSAEVSVRMRSPRRESGGGAPRRSAPQARLELGDAIEQLERERDARRVDLEVVHQPGRQAHARERVAAEAPLLARRRRSAPARLRRPRPRSAARRAAGAAQLDQSSARPPLRRRCRAARWRSFDS